MRSPPLIILATLCILLLRPPHLDAWCWVRDTGATSTGCSAPTLFMESCCNGNPRKWATGTLDFYISNSTPPGMVATIIAGAQIWNDVTMSSFGFSYQGQTARTSVANDGTNLISMDPNFATNNGLLGQGVIAISATWTQDDGTAAYRAIESDIVFNGEEFTWGDGTGGTIDTLAIVAHETGHNAGLSHAGAICQNDGSEGCGAELRSATMYWNYAAGQPTNKASLELDDAAALIAEYPVSTLRVRVDNPSGDGMPGVTVLLLDAAAPVGGTTPAQGGRVFGDVTNSAVLMGDKTPSLSYVNQSPFAATDADGFTNFIHPTHRTFRISASAAGATQTVTHTVANGTSTLTLTLADGIPPVVSAVTPADGATGVSVNSAVTATFNETMDASTLTGASFTNAQGVPGAVTYDAATHTVAFTPSSPLAHLTAYTFSLTTAIHDVSGNALAAPVTWSFQTQAPASGSGGGGCFIQAAPRKTPE